MIRKIAFTGLTVAASAVVPLYGLAAQEHQEHAEEHAAATSIKQQYLSDLGTLERKFLALAEAMSADQYSWRPMEGTRSVSEVYMLIVAENYVVPAAWEATPPEDMEVGPQLFGTLPNVTDKAEVLEHLRKSFAYYKGVVGELSVEQLHSTIQFFGQERSVNEAVFLITTDMHEHLGQAIAYARMNHVVPPWSAGN
jgi:hypothetical protein